MINFDDPVGQLNSEHALTTFENSHRDIMRSPEMIVKANQLLEVATNYIPLTELTPEQLTAALEKTAKATRAWFNLAEPKAAATSPRPQTEEEMRKAAIEELRKGRGQQV